MSYVKRSWTYLLPSIDQLQREQQAHDELAHADVLTWTQEGRMDHYQAHFGKYATRLGLPILGWYAASGPQTGPLPQRLIDPKVLVDALIICLAASNCLKAPLRPMVAACTQARGEDHLDRINPLQLATVMLNGSSTVSKLCDDKDHDPSYDWKNGWMAALGRMAYELIGHLARTQDPAEAVRARWRQIENGTTPA